MVGLSLLECWGVGESEIEERNRFVKLDMDSCRKIDYITIPYSIDSQIITNC